jgi:hypothetical protein
LAALAFTSAESQAQTAIVGPADQYAFQWENFGGLTTNIGLFFSSSQGQFQFRDGGGSTIMSLDPSNGRVNIGDNVTNYARFDGNGDLRFFGTADYLVENNDYAFRSAGDPDNGLYFKVTNNRYEFRSNTAVGSFTITANNSGGVVSGSFHSDGDGDIDLEVNGEGTYTSFANNSAADDGDPLAVGPRTGSHLAFDNNEVQTYSGAAASGIFYAQFYGGNLDLVNNVGGGNMNVSGSVLYVRGSDDFVGVGT